MPGLLGVVLLVAATAAVSYQWRSHQAALEALSRGPTAAPRAAANDGATVARPPARLLPEASALPQLLSRIERTATASGLGWPRADYRVIAATQDAPASLEVRCTLKGPYPAVRRFVTALLQDTPALTLKEFALSRTSADVADVEAKLAVVVYLAAGTSAAEGTRP